MRRLSRSSLAWVVLLASAVVWAGLVLGTPLLGRDPNGGIGAVVASGAYLAGALLCHQRPDRSFHLAGAQLPVCGRCTGLYLSAAVGILLALLRIRRFSSRGWLLAAAVPSLVTLAVEWSGAWPVSNAVRAAAAVPLGFVVGALLVEAAGFRGRL